MFITTDQGIVAMSYRCSAANSEPFVSTDAAEPLFQGEYNCIEYHNRDRLLYAVASHSPTMSANSLRGPAVLTHGADGKKAFVLQQQLTLWDPEDSPQYFEGAVTCGDRIGVAANYRYLSVCHMFVCFA
eukprot:TRINITY_DN6123_c0_g1_i2.p2 TRINITY_DN6123_c0_g1~~TRINITY_DN6123_c0_g1_i2.p2  ORF type:complete len:129 (-),score=33.89 TRINITY_DN6123_c0_g1_i2:1003-1389(-)